LSLVVSHVERMDVICNNLIGIYLLLSPPSSINHHKPFLTLSSLVVSHVNQQKSTATSYDLSVKSLWFLGTQAELKSMPDFALTTIWTIPAPIEAVWWCLLDTENWTTWWSYVVSVERIDNSASSKFNHTRRYLWHTCLPYVLSLDLRVTKLQTYQCISVAVSGDLQGYGDCQFIAVNNVCTQIEFHWYVTACKPWMNRLTWLAHPVFVWNHDKVMRQGERGLIRYLAAKKI
jgi:hypothetical protein